jgi:DNA-binding MarR family transcriptional regulator
MASLVALPDKQKVDFSYLRKLLGLTDGNLGAHLQKLEETQYIAVEKTFVARKPCTYVSATTTGRAAFEKHVAALNAILKPGSGGEVNPE